MATRGVLLRVLALLILAKPTDSDMTRSPYPSGRGKIKYRCVDCGSEQRFNRDRESAPTCRSCGGRMTPVMAED
jgi:hypothetical protein